MQSSNNAGVTSLIDTHCHLDFDVFDDCRGDIIATCENRNFKAIIVPGVIQSDWLHLLGICKQYKLLHAALGIHPYYVSSHTVMQLESLVDYIAKHNPIAVGEIGLDYFCDDVDRCRQVMFFSRQLEIAKEAGLPVLLHVRKAHDQVLQLIKKTKFDCGGIVHAFSGSEQQAVHYLERGFKLGVGGAATYDRAKKIHRILRDFPLPSFVLETDSPDLRPCFAKETNNTPLNLFGIANCIADIKGVSVSTLCEVTTSTAQALFCSSFEFEP